MKIRKERERGSLNLGWLQANYTFSFASFFDPDFMRFKSLRVINNDIIAPGGGFDTHPHKNMEILSFILRGELEHKDTMGNHSIIKTRDIQLLSAGSGVFHSEFNPSSSEETELFQIWIEAKKKDTKPYYNQFSCKKELEVNKPSLIATNKEVSGVAHINQSIHIYLNQFDQRGEFIFKKEFSYWVQLVEGSIEINGQLLSGRDGVGLEKAELDSFEIISSAEFLVFEFLD